MKYLNEFRVPDRVHTLQSQIKSITKHCWKIMEICGGQTHAIAKYGLFDLLPPEIELIHGPGCPVCVTPKSILDFSITLAKQPDIIFCSFGDMLRVPGTDEDLLAAKAQGANIKMIYSPLEALQLAQTHPDKQIVLFGVGFETTAPTHAMAVIQAKKLKLTNFSLLTSLVTVPAAIAYLLAAPNTQIQGFLAAGHVCTIMGLSAYQPLAKQYHVPIVITGFEPVDILQGVYHCIQQLESNQATVENQYQRMVQNTGNPYAQEAINTAFELKDAHWRGIGLISKSGLFLREAYRDFDALYKYSTLKQTEKAENNLCISGQILQGLKKPPHCSLFGKVCTPENPIGAPMVSSEGACRAYYLYQRESHA